MSKYSREELCACTARELMRLATALGVKGSWDMKKAQVIEAILERTKEPETPTACPECKVPYIESASVGTLVAFRLPNGKVKSAALVNRSSASRVVLLETAYGARYRVSYDDIVWVRTGKFWPKGVYQLLTGQVGCVDGQAKK